jgi:polar amino acid transport system substrate-binding protein
MRAVIIILIAVLSIPTVFAADKPAIKVCYENEDSYPWILKDRPGLNILMLNMVEKRLGSKIEMIQLPWRRCLSAVKLGNMDAVFKISFSPARAAELGNFPMIGDQPDTSKRMLTQSYSLYKLKGTELSWDGSVLKIKGAVGAQAGFSAIDQIRGMGITVDDGSPSPEKNLEKLLFGRFSAVALQTEQGDFCVEKNPEFKAKIERISPVLVKKAYYLIFSKQFTAKHPEHVDATWKTIEQVRESAEYIEITKAFK